jgi:hypothetical protein
LSASERSIVACIRPRLSPTPSRAKRRARCAGFGETPPIYGGAGRTASLTGEKHTSEDVFVGCDPTPLPSFLDLRDGVWARLEEIEVRRPDGSSAAPRGIWHVYVDETEIAAVPGHRLSVP